MAEFDPDSIGIANGNFFGLPCTAQEADTVLIQVPWDATVSYGKGTADGPSAMMEASLQVDLFDERFQGVAGMKVWTLPQNEEIRKINSLARQDVEKVIAALEAGEEPDSLSGLCERVNEASGRMNAYVESVSEEYLAQGRSVAVIGGEHSVPLGLIRALSGKFPGMGVLHVDAHSDTRKAYEGFTYSHASIMYNVMEQCPGVSRIAQVGIRDFCSAEYSLVTSSPLFSAFTDFRIKERLFAGISWNGICNDIISTLPRDVYVSFDIDGLSPEYCPSTGTPVPGGLSFAQADWLLWRLVNSGRRIVGFDLCEVAPGERGEWDANVGARMLFKLLMHSAFSNGKIPIFAR